MSSINPFFYANYYLARNPDLVRAGLFSADQLWSHYVQYGAWESEVVSSRSPTNWFDVNYYLAMYPDLILHGVSAATALDHFYQYGLWENREVNALVSIHDFSYQSYAQANRDLQEVFAIEDADALSPLQKQQLFSHYLQYGFKENRLGIGPEDMNLWAQLVNERLVINTNTGRYIGTIGDDEFHVLAGTARGQTIDGLGGNDWVVLQKGELNNTISDVLLRHIESVKIEGVAFSSLMADSHLAQLELRAPAAETNRYVVDLSIQKNNSISHSLELDIYGRSAWVSLNHIEQVHLGVQGNSVMDMYLNMNQLSGSTFSVTIHDQLVGSEMGTTGQLHLTLDSQWSAALVHYEVDASAMRADWVLVEMPESAQGQIHQVASRTVYVGQGHNQIEASAAIENIYMGQGTTQLIFSSSSQAMVRVAATHHIAIDTIIGFKQGDVITLPAGQTLSAHYFQTGQLGSDKTLEQLIDEVGAGKVFQWQQDSYVVLSVGLSATDATGAEVIKLAGVPLENVDLGNATQELRLLL